MSKIAYQSIKGESIVSIYAIPRKFLGYLLTSVGAGWMLSGATGVRGISTLQQNDYEINSLNVFLVIWIVGWDFLPSKSPGNEGHKVQVLKT